MSEKLSSIVGGVGEFISREIGQGQTVATAVSGNLAVITPPSGQRVRLTHLSTLTAVSRTNVSLIFGATKILDDKTISGEQPHTDSFSIGSYSPYGTATPPNGNHQYVTGKRDEALTIFSESMTGLGAVYYGYEIGE